MRRYLVGFLSLSALVLLGNFVKGDAANAAYISNVHPNDTSSLIVSAYNGPGEFYSPESISYLYVPEGWATGQVRLADISSENASPPRIRDFTVQAVDASGGCTGGYLAAAGGVIGNYDVWEGHQHTFGNGGATKTQAGYKMYCVRLTTITAYPGFGGYHVNFKLDAWAGQNIGNYPGPNAGTGTGYYRNVIGQSPLTPGVWGKELDFAAPCDANPAAVVNEVVHLYDLDTYSAVNNSLRIQIWEADQGVGNWAAMPLVDPSPAVWPAGSYDLVPDVFTYNYYPSGIGSGASIAIRPTTNFKKFKDYRLFINGVGHNNKIRIRLPFDQITAGRPCAKPACTITAVQTIGGSSTIHPGDQLRFIINVSNATGYLLGANNANYGSGESRNYLVNNAWSYVRTPVPADQNGFVATLYALNRDSGPWDQAIYAPASTGTFNFYWGFVAPGIGWESSCAASFTVIPNVTCNITAIGPVSDPAIYPGSRIRFNITASNASGYTFRTSTGNYAGAGRTASYNANGTYTVNNYDSGANVFAPGGAPGSYNFNWEFTRSGFPTVSCPATVSTTSPPAIPECTITITRLSNNLPFLEPGGRFRVDYTIRNAQTSAFGLSFSGASWPFTLDPRSIAGAGTNFTNNSYPSLGPGQSYSNSSAIYTANAPSGTYEILSYLRGGATYVYCNNNVPTATPPPPTGCNPAVEDCCPPAVPCTPVPETRGPYVRAYGGDVIAGSGIEIAGACPTNPAGAINTFITYRNDAPAGITGSGTQMASYALGAISGFRTNTQNNNARPQARAFANLPPNTRPTTNYGTATSPTETFGGSYGGGLCASEWGAAPSDATPIAGANFDMTNQVGTFTRTGDLNLSASGVITGKKTIFVAGNVYITGGANMVYDTTWASVDDVTSVVVVATGNILISPTVRNLDGFYVSRGIIYTCYNPANPTILNITNSATNVPCINAQLTINGALLAPDIRFWRLGGTTGLSTPSEDYSLSSGRTGETIRLSSEFLFADQSTESQNGSEGGLDRTYDAITSLPPTF